MRNIETFPSKQMYPYLSLVERKVAEFYHNMDRRRHSVRLKWLIFITFSRQLLVSLLVTSELMEFQNYENSNRFILVAITINISSKTSRSRQGRGGYRWWAVGTRGLRPPPTAVRDPPLRGVLPSARVGRYQFHLSIKYNLLPPIWYSSNWNADRYKKEAFSPFFAHQTFLKWPFIFGFLTFVLQVLVVVQVRMLM